MAKHVYRYEHPLLDNWLRDTTCHNYWIARSVLFENEEFIVLKHNSHACYAGRFPPSPTRNCSCYAALYRKSDINLNAAGYNANLYGGTDELSKWEGRISKSKILDECRSIEIEFPEIYVIPTTEDDVRNIEADSRRNGNGNLSINPGAQDLIQKAKDLKAF